MHSNPYGYGKGQSAQQDPHEVDFHSWENYDMKSFKSVIEDNTPWPGVSNVFHAYHSEDGKRYRDAALHKTQRGLDRAGPVKDSFDGFFQTDLGAKIAPNPNEDFWWHAGHSWYSSTDQELFTVRQSQFSVLHHFVSMKEAHEALLRDCVLKCDYISIVDQPNGSPLLFKSFGSFDDNFDPYERLTKSDAGKKMTLLEHYQEGKKEMPWNIKPTSKHGETPKHPCPKTICWNDMVWEEEETFGILIMKGTSQAIDKVKKARRSSKEYLTRFPPPVPTDAEVVKANLSKGIMDTLRSSSQLFGTAP